MKLFRLSVLFCFATFSLSAQYCSKFIDFVISANINSEVNVFTHLESPSLDIIDGCKLTHFGTDIWTGETREHPVISPGYGEVIKSEKHSSSTIGYYTIIKYPKVGPLGGDIYMTILHYNQLPTQLSTVYAGDVIGFTGINNDVNHVHFELRNFSTLTHPDVTGCFGTSNIYGAGDYKAENNPAIHDYWDPCAPPRGIFSIINQQTEINISQGTEHIQIRIPKTTSMNFSGLTSQSIKYLRFHREPRTIFDFENDGNEIRFKINVGTLINFETINRTSLGFTLELSDRNINFAGIVNIVNVFEDVLPDDIYQDYISRAATYGLLKGYSNGTFGSQINLTKGAAAKVIIQAAFKLGILSIHDYTTGPFYRDIDNNHGLAPYVYTLEHELSSNGLPLADLGIPSINPNTSFGLEEDISIALFATWLRNILSINPNNGGIDRDSDISIPTTNNSYINQSLNALFSAFNKNQDESIESILTSLGTPNNIITRGAMAKALINAFEIRKKELENSGSLRNSQNQIFDNYTIIGDKNELYSLGQIASFDVESNYSLTMISNDPPLELGPSTYQDSGGNDLNFYWTSNGGNLVSNSSKRNKVAWTPPAVTTSEIFFINFYVSQIGGKAGKSRIKITVFPDESIPPPTSILLNSSLNKNTASSFELISISGNASYNNSLPVALGTIKIISGELVYFTETDQNGDFSKNFAAPEFSGQIIVEVEDEDFNASNSHPISIDGGANNPNGWELHYSNHYRYVNGNIGPSEQTDKISVKWGRFYTWLEFTNIDDRVQTKLEYFRPTGQKLYEIESNYSPPGESIWPVWFYMFVEGNSWSDYQGLWNVKIYARRPNEQYTFIKSLPFSLSHLFIENKICKFVDFTNCTTGSDECPVVGEGKVFKQTDTQIYAYSHFKNVRNELDLKAEFIEPNGSVYEVVYDNIPNPGFETQAWIPNWFQAFYLNIDGQSIQNKTGYWQIKFFTKDPFGNWDLEYVDDFEFRESPNISPTITITSDKPRYLPEEIILLDIEAIDNTYLSEVELVYSVNGFNNEVRWNNINSNSKVISNFNIGSYPCGTKVEVHTKASDNSQNSTFTELLEIPILPCDCDENLYTINYPLDTNFSLHVQAEIRAEDLINEPSNTLLKAGQSISIKPGFHAKPGSVFNAQIDGCNE